MPTRDPNATRRRMNQIQAAPVVIDATGTPINLEDLRSQELAYPLVPTADGRNIPTGLYRIARCTPQTIERDTPQLLDPNLLNIVYTETWPARISGWFQDGEGVLITMAVVTAGVFTWFVVDFALALYAAYFMVTGAIITYGPAALAILVALGLVSILRPRGGGGMIPLHACPKSGITGHVYIPAWLVTKGR